MGVSRGPSTIDVSPLLFPRDDVRNFRRATASLALARERAFWVSVKLHKPPRNERDQPPEQDRDRKGAAICVNLFGAKVLGRRACRGSTCATRQGMQVFPLEHVLIGVLWLAVT